MRGFYKIHVTQKKWIDARTRCSLEGATLWSPETEEEFNYVKKFWENTPSKTTYIYIGLNDLLSKKYYLNVDGM